MKNNFRYTLAIFDFDGTLVDSKDDIIDSVLKTLKAFNLPEISYETIYSHVGTGIEPVLTKSASLNSKISLTELLDFFKKDYSANLLNKTKFYPGVKDELETLNGTVISAVLTNKRKFFLDKTIAGLKADKLFSYSFGGDSFPTKKPDPIAIEYMINETAIERERVIIVGDSSVDVEAGKRAGIKTCAVTYGYSTIEKLSQSKPDFMKDSFKEVIKLIKGEED